MVWALALAVPAVAQTPRPPVVRDGAAVPAVQMRELLREGSLALVLVQPLPGDGLLGSHLRAIRSGVTTDIPLDGTVTGRRARAIGAVRLLAGGRRVVLHLDPEQEASGLLVVDLAAGAVIDAITGHDLVASPDGRFWAFEEHAIRTVAVWPHTEMVYAVGAGKQLVATDDASDWPPEVTAAIFALESPGALSPLVETTDAFYLVRLVAREESRLRPLASVGEALRGELQREKYQALRAAQIAALTASFPVAVDEALFEKLEPAAVRPPPLPGER